MEVIKENKEYLGKCSETKYGVIPCAMIENINALVAKYWGTNIYTDCALCVSEYDYYSLFDPKSAKWDRTNYVIDLNTTKSMKEAEFNEKYKDAKVKRQLVGMYNFTAYVKGFVEDNIYVLLESYIDTSIRMGDTVTGDGIKVGGMYFVFKNRTAFSVTFIDDDEFIVIKKDLKELIDSFGSGIHHLPYEFECIRPNDKWDAYQELINYLSIQYGGGKLLNLNIEKDMQELSKIGVRKKEWEIDSELDALNRLVTNMEAPDNAKGHFILYERYGDVTVMRFMIAQKNSKAAEIYRVFFKKDKIVSLENTSCYGFVRTNKSLYKALRKWIVDKDSIPADVDDFKYITDLFKDRKLDAMDLVLMKGNNVIEWLCKTGMENFAKILLNFCRKKSVTLETAVETHIGKTGSMENIYSYLGINKHQYKKMQIPIYTDGENADDISFTHRRLHIRIIKYIFGMDNIASINNAQFDAVFDWIEGMCFHAGAYAANSTLFEGPVNKDNKNFNIYFHALKAGYEYYDSIMKSLKLIKPTWEADGSWMTGAQIMESFQMAKELRNHKMYSGDPLKGCVCGNLSFYYKIGGLHKTIYRLYHTYKDAIDNEAYEKFREMQERLYAYKNNMYTIKPPEFLNDLLVEGEALSHCVGEFVNAVKEGKTNILFLRRNNQPDKPFFTIEVKGKTVKQIHGKCNRNVNTVEGLDSFIDEWVEQKKLRKGDCDRLLGPAG